MADMHMGRVPTHRGTEWLLKRFFSRQIAEALKTRGINAPRGGQWRATSVRNVMTRA